MGTNPYKFCDGQGCFACGCPLDLEKTCPPRLAERPGPERFFYFAFCGEDCARQHVVDRYTRDLRNCDLAFGDNVVDETTSMVSRVTELFPKIARLPEPGDTSECKDVESDSELSKSLTDVMAYVMFERRLAWVREEILWCESRQMSLSGGSRAVGIRHFEMQIERLADDVSWYEEKMRGLKKDINARAERVHDGEKEENGKEEEDSKEGPLEAG